MEHTFSIEGAHRPKRSYLVTALVAGLALVAVVCLYESGAQQRCWILGPAGGNTEELVSSEAVMLFSFFVPRP